MLHSISTYCKYLIASKNQYGIHSPFLFDFLTKGLADSKKIDLKKAFTLREELLHDHREIDVSDFGAGSKVFKNNQRSLSKIASTAGISKKRGELLAKTTAYFKPKSILEIGTSLGISTTFMAAGAPEALITTLEGCPSTATIAQENFQKLHLDKVEVIVGEFDLTLDQALQNTTYGLIFFDGNHQKESTLKYFEKCLAAASEASVFIFDDIHWTKDMEAAWCEIKNHEQVTLSVDTFKWGLVFFSKGREKEHFTIRI